MRSDNADPTHALDKKETKVLFTESVRGQKLFLPTQIDLMFEATLSSGLEFAELLGASRDELKEARKTLLFQSKDLKARALKQLNEVCDSCIRDADSLSEQLFVRMDDDRDLTITKSEFVKNFHRAHNEVSTVHTAVVSVLLVCAKNPNVCRVLCCCDYQLVNIAGMLAMMQQSMAE